MKTPIIAAATLALSALAANAAPLAVDSELNIVGTSNFTTSQVTFANPADSLVSTGSLAPFNGCTGCVTMASPFTFNPFTAGNVWTATLGSLVATMDITSNVSTDIGPHTISVVDNGTISLTGFTPTAGIYTLTANQVTGKLAGSFSSTSAANAPEPMSIGLLGMGLAGLAFVRRRSSLN